MDALSASAAGIFRCGAETPFPSFFLRMRAAMFLILMYARTIISTRRARANVIESDVERGRVSASFFECFPYVCPEPVLAKCSFLYINGSKMPFFAGFFFSLCSMARWAGQVGNTLSFSQFP
jgi:hypothetical protein